MYTITKEFTFEAAHRLLGHPKCGRLHGHSYKVIVELRADTLNTVGDSRGMVLDYAKLDAIKEYIDTQLDHRYLFGEELDLANDPYAKIATELRQGQYLSVHRTTAEELAHFLFDEFVQMYPQLTAITVCETAKTSATYAPEWQQD